MNIYLSISTDKYQSANKNIAQIFCLFVDYDFLSRALFVDDQRRLVGTYENADDRLDAIGT